MDLVDEELLFIDDPACAEELLETPWVVMVVDDDPDVHEATDLALDGYRFEGRPVAVLHAFSGTEAEALLTQRTDVAAIFLDVVMESQTAGLDLVDRIRLKLNNHWTRIILRTGQPSSLSELEVLDNYDINDYRLKSDLTRQKLVSALVMALRGYRDIMHAV